MARYASFKQAAVPGTPDYVNAEIQRARIANQVTQSENQQQRQLLADGATAYDKFTGESTPIRDYTTSLVDSLRGDGGGPQVSGPVLGASGGLKGADAGAVQGAEQAGMGAMAATPAMAAPAIEPTGGMLDGLRASGQGMDAASAADAAMMPDTMGAVDGVMAGAEGAGGAVDGAVAGAEGIMAGADGGLEAAEAAGALDGVSAGGLLSALRGADQIAKGDVAGAASTGVQAYLATLGPAGIAAGLLMGLVS